MRGKAITGLAYSGPLLGRRCARPLWDRRLLSGDIVPPPGLLLGLAECGSRLTAGARGPVPDSRRLLQRRRIQQPAARDEAAAGKPFAALSSAGCGVSLSGSGASSSPALQLAVARSCGPARPEDSVPRIRARSARAQMLGRLKEQVALGGERHHRAIQRSIVSSTTPPDVFALSECSPCSKTRIMRELPSSTSAVRPRARADGRTRPGPNVGSSRGPRSANPGLPCRPPRLGRLRG